MLTEVANARVNPATWAERFNRMFALIVGEFAKVQGPQRWARGYLLSSLTQWRRARCDEQGAEKYG